MTGISLKMEWVRDWEEGAGKERKYVKLGIVA